MAGRSNYKHVSDWHSPTNIKALEGELCLGDRLEFDCGASYAHWGIYVGEYEDMRHAVIDFGLYGGESVSTLGIGAIRLSSGAGQKPKVRANTIEKILDGSGKVEINNEKDNDVPPLNSEAIIEKAKKMHKDKKKTEYNLVNNNCEHFVNLCRYNDPDSKQVKDTIWTTVVCGIGALVGFAALKIVNPSS